MHAATTPVQVLPTAGEDIPLAPVLRIVVRIGLSARAGKGLDPPIPRIARVIG
jgi:hypothetical protein